MKPVKKQNKHENFKWTPQRRKLVASMLQSPRNASLKEIYGQAGVSYSNASEVMAHLRKNMLPPLKKIYFPESSFSVYRMNRSLRSGLAKKLERMIRKDPYAQLPSKRLGEEYGFSREAIVSLAAKIRRKLGFSGVVQKGGARIKYPEKASAIIREFAGKSKAEGKPVIARDLIIEIARNAKIAVSANGLRGYCKRLGASFSFSRMPVVKDCHGTMDSTLELLKREGLRQGIDFAVPKRQRYLGIQRRKRQE